MDDFTISNPEYVWLGLAALLALAELFVPGVFLIWVAAAAAVTGILSLFIDLTFAGQLTVFGLSTILAVLGGRRWYLTPPCRKRKSAAQQSFGAAGRQNRYRCRGDLSDQRARESRRRRMAGERPEYGKRHSR
jgi:membrane protein implicated in regulation of membrane protease activity